MAAAGGGYQRSVRVCVASRSAPLARAKILNSWHLVPASPDSSTLNIYTPEALRNSTVASVSLSATTLYTLHSPHVKLRQTLFTKTASLSQPVSRSENCAKIFKTFLKSMRKLTTPISNWNVVEMDPGLAGGTKLSQNIATKRKQNTRFWCCCVIHDDNVYKRHVARPFCGRSRSDWKSSGSRTPRWRVENSQYYLPAHSFEFVRLRSANLGCLRRACAPR